MYRVCRADAEVDIIRPLLTSHAADGFFFFNVGLVG